MKSNFYVIAVTIFFATIANQPAYAQKYKTAADTVRLNQEYADVSKNILDLKARIAEAQSELPNYQSKATAESAQAQAAAAESSHEASKAKNGDLGDVKKAKKKANKAVDEAEDAKDAQNKVKEQNKKIEKLNSQLQKKQKRLQDLDEMRSRIMTMSR